MTNRLLHIQIRLLFALFIFNTTYAVGQNLINVSVTLLPPYSPHFEDYLIYENKATFIISSLPNPTGEDYEIYFAGSIEGDNGITVRSKENYKPSTSIIVPSGSTTILTGGELSNYFSYNNVDVQGIELSNIFLGDGLPEGNYSICLRAFDFSTDEPLSAEFPMGCSPNILIQHIDPPQVLSPVCEQNVLLQDPQTMVINWTIPPGSNPLTTEYILSIAEVYEGQNPLEVFLALPAPPFFEATTTLPNYIFSLADPQLIEGQQYAIQVQAIDRNNLQAFKNEGRSEVCWFTYGTEQIVISTATEGNINVQGFDFEEILEQLKNTRVSGQLLCKNIGFNTQDLIDLASVKGEVTGIIDFLDSNTGGGNNPGVGIYATPMQSVTYGGILGAVVDQSHGIGSFGFNHQGIYIESGTPTLFQNPIKGKKYLNENLQTTNGAIPLKNTTVKLVMRIVMRDFEKVDAAGNVEPVEYALTESTFFKDQFGGNMSIPYMDDIVVDTDITDENGNYEFNFHLSQAMGYLGKFASGSELNPDFDPNIVEVNPNPLINPAVRNTLNPVFQIGHDAANGLGGQSNQTQYYMYSPQGGSPMMNSAQNGWLYICLKLEVDDSQFCSPDVDIIPAPGDDLTIPTQVSLMKSYALDLKVKSADEAAFRGGGPLPGVQVDVVRPTAKLYRAKEEVLALEGEQNPTIESSDLGEVRILADGKTDGKGKVMIANLAKHRFQNIGDSPYTLQLSTRDPDKLDSDVETSELNYSTTYYEIPTLVNFEGNDNVAFSTPVTYNRFYSIPTVPYEVTMNPLSPEIKGRTIEASNIDLTGLEGVKVNLFANDLELNGGSWIDQITRELEQTHLTENTGFFRFKDLMVNLDGNTTTGPYRRVELSKYGYGKIHRPDTSVSGYKLSKGYLLNLNNINFKPLGSIKGYVEGPNGEGVESYLKVESGAYYRTESEIISAGVNADGQYTEVTKENFQMLAEASTHARLIVEPLSSKYFPLDTLIDISSVESAGTLDIGKIKLKERIHQLTAFVYDDGGRPVENALIKLDGKEKITNYLGRVDFGFPSQANTFMLTVIPPGNLVPQQIPLYIPANPKPKTVYINLKAGKGFNGVVRSAGTNTPIEGARVYSLVSQANGESLYVEASTNADGVYRLEGVPIISNGGNYALTAVKEGGAISYIGQTKTLHTNTRIDEVDFKLTPIDGWKLDKILGFPMVITSFQSNGANEATVDGYLHDLPNNIDFAPQNDDIEIPFNNQKIRRIDGGKVEPESVLELSVSSIPVRVQGMFKARLIALSQQVGNFYLPQKLALQKRGAQTGAISGKIKLDIASFGFAYNFGGHFYIGEKSDQSIFDVFKTTSAQRKDYFVFDLSGNDVTDISNYNVFGFNAKADRANSKLKNGKIHLATVLETNIPSCEPANLAIEIGDIIISHNDINLQQGNTSGLSFQLEKWRVNSEGSWHFNKNEESIELSKALIVTGNGLDFRVEGMKILPNELREGKIGTQGSFTLGGVADLKLSTSVKPFFGYDQGIKHYYVAFFPEGSNDINTNDKIGYIDDLPGMDQGDKIEFDNMTMQSDNVTPITISKTMRYHDIMDFQIYSLTTENGFLSFSGMPKLNIPNITSSMGAITYTKENGVIVDQLTPMQSFVDGKGYVRFRFDNTVVEDNQTPYQSIKDGRFTSYGRFQINPDPDKYVGANTILLRGFLDHSAAGTTIEIIDVDENGYKGNFPQSFKMNKNGETTALKIKEGRMQTNGPSWQTLKYTAILNELEGLASNENPQANEMKFEVAGDIKADATGVQIDKVETPIGEMELTYDFNEQSLTGDIDIKEPVQMGPAELTSGLMNMRIDGDGYYLAGAVEMSLGGSGLKGGFMIGNHDNIIEEHRGGIFEVFTNPNIVPSNIRAGRIKGIWVGGERTLFTLPNFEIEPIFSISGALGLGAYVNVDFSNGSLFQLGGYAYAFCNMSGLCIDFGDPIPIEYCPLCFSANAFLGITAQYDGSNFDLLGEGSVNFQAKPFPEIDLGIVENPFPTFEVSAWMTAQHGTSGFMIDFGLGDLYSNGMNQSPNCPPKTE